MSVQIHPLSVVEKGAELGNHVTIGPFCHIGSHVKIGSGSDLKSHVVIEGHTTIGEETVIFPFSSLGHRPQDKKFQGEYSTLEIGKQNVIREHVTMNPGTEGGGGLTKIGDYGLFMTGVHIAHDCHIGNHAIFANHATLGGHVCVGDYVVIGGLSAIHQFVRIGSYAMIGGMSGVEQDVIPYGVIVGERASLSGLNLIGLRRRHFSAAIIQQLREVYKILFHKTTGDFEKSTLLERTDKILDEYQNVDEVRSLLDFIKNDSKRKICRPRDE